MARLAVILTVTSFLFAFSHARMPLDLPENDVNFSNTLPLDKTNIDVPVRDSSNDLPESETKITLLLPSEKPESEPATVVEWESDATEEKHQAETITVETTDLPVSETDTVTTVGVTRPLTFVNFHPVNRHFNRMHDRRPFPFRFPHPCRHHFKHGGPRPRFNGREMPYGNDMILSSSSNEEATTAFKQGDPRPRVDGREIPYGNDMILSSSNEEKTTADPTMFRRSVPQIPARWIRFHQHGRPRFPLRQHRHHDWNEEEDVKRPHHHHHHHHMHEREENQEMEKEHHEERHEEREGGGFMKSFRKFLHHF